MEKALRPNVCADVYFYWLKVSWENVFGSATRVQYISNYYHKEICEQTRKVVAKRNVWWSKISNNKKSKQQKEKREIICNTWVLSKQISTTVQVLAQDVTRGTFNSKQISFYYCSSWTFSALGQSKLADVFYAVTDIWTSHWIPKHLVLICWIS